MKRINFGFGNPNTGEGLPEKPALSLEEKVIQGWFRGGNANVGWLWEGEGAGLYKAMIDSGVNRPDGVEREIIMRHRSEIQQHVRNIFVMLAAGDGAKERELLGGYPGLGALYITGLESSMARAANVIESFNTFASHEGVKFQHPPSFHVVPLEQVSADTFSDDARQRLTYTSLGCNIGMKHRKENMSSMKKLFRTHFTGKDDTFIFSYFEEPKTEEDILRSKRIYLNKEAERFVMTGVEKQFSKISGYSFNRSKWRYNVHYNKEERQMEVGIIPDHDGGFKFADGTEISYQKNEVITVYTSARYRDFEINNLLSEASLSMRKKRSQDGVVVAVADARRRARIIGEQTLITLLIIFSLGGVYLGNKQEIEKGIKNKLEMWRKNDSSDGSIATFVEEYDIYKLSGDSLVAWRETTSHELAQAFHEMYGGSEESKTDIQKIIYDMMPQIENRYMYLGEREGYDQMHVLVKVVFPVVKTLIISEEGAPYLYKETDEYEVQIFNTLFPDEHIPTASDLDTGPLYGAGEAIYMDYTKDLGVFTVLPLERAWGYIGKAGLYTSGSVMSVRAPMDESEVHESEFFRTYHGYENYGTGQYAKSVLRGMIYWKYAIVHESMDIIYKRFGYTPGGSDAKQLAELFVDYRFHGYIKGASFKEYNPHSPLPRQIENVIAGFEKELSGLLAQKELIYKPSSTPNSVMSGHLDAVHNMLNDNWKNQIPYGIHIQDVHLYKGREIGVYTTRQGSMYYLYEVVGKDNKPYLVGCKADIPIGENTVRIGSILTADCIGPVIRDMQ